MQAATAESGGAAAGGGVVIKFRSSVAPTEKRAAVRAAIQHVSPAALAAEAERDSPRASMRVQKGWDDDGAAAVAPPSADDVALVGALREQLRGLVLEGGSYQAVLRATSRTGVSKRCIFQVDAHGRMAAYPRLQTEVDEDAEGAINELRDTSQAPYAYCFVDELERVEVSSGDLSEAEAVEKQHGEFAVEISETKELSGWVWVEEKQKKSKSTFVKRWGKFDREKSELSWYHAPPDLTLPNGMEKLLVELTANTPQPANPEHVKAVTVLSMDTAGGQAEATSMWLAEALTTALAEGSVTRLFKTLTILQIMIRAGSTDLASAISLNCRPVVLMSTELDAGAADVASEEAAGRAVTDIHAVAAQLMAVMNTAEPTSPSAGGLQPIATASLAGCNASPPKTARKEFPYALRIELAQPDTAGVAKYILGFQGAATLQAWRDGFASIKDATSKTKLSGKGKIAKTRRAVAMSATKVAGLDRADLSTESVCEVTLHFAALAVVADDAADAGVAMLGDEEGKDTGGGGTIKRRAGLGTEPLRLGFRTSVEAQEFCSILNAQLERYMRARARTMPQLRVVAQRLNQTFSGESEWDMKQLRLLWSHVYDEREYVQGTSEFETVKAWVSDGWRDMGFQNADPSTDLRAMGMLGVHCLLRFAETRTDYVRAICAVAGSRAGCYPFALTGINLGKLMVDLLELRQVDPVDITDADDPGPSLLRCWQTPLIALFCQLPEETEDVFEVVFARLVQVFERAWLMSGCSSVMDFAAVYDRVAVALTAHLDRRGTLQELDELSIDASGLGPDAPRPEF